LLAPDWEIYYKAVHPDDIAKAEQAVVEGLAGAPIEYEFRAVRPDGSERIIYTKGEVVRDAGGRPLLVRGTAQDVTERKRLEEALQAQNQRLKELNRLKLDFVSSVSHELRAPITTILGYADFLDEVLAPDQADARAFTNHIRRGARRLQRLVGDLGDFALLEAGAFVLRSRAEDLASCALEAASALGPQLEQARLTLALELPGDLPRIQFDRQRIGQVLANMLENAIRATPPGGRVGLRVLAQPQALRCEVTDTGRGIDPAEHAKVFQRYAIIGDPANRGSGLGLNISKSLVEAHGGAIGFESASGQGSTFWFELPLDVIK
jgi:two-component system CheB/CheR fusion protein